MKITDLGGHSGCKIVLCEAEDDTLFVRKTSGSMEYNSRLKIQVQKQQDFRNDYIKTPKVLDSGINSDGYFFFDMEYIKGITLAEYMKTIEVGRVKDLTEQIVKGIAIEKQLVGGKAQKVFKEKICALKRTLSVDGNENLKQVFELLEQHDWSNIRETKCHGDLTLENIIVRNGQLYFIDFLDSFYESWIFDVSTLLQDAQIFWAYRNQAEIGINTQIRLMIFKDILLDELRKKDAHIIIDVYYALLLKLVRILPYTVDKMTLSFLNDKILYLGQWIRNNSL